MDVLLRNLRPGAGGIAEYRDVEITVDEVTVGSSADRTIQLLGASVAGEHAEIQLHGGDIRVRCTRGQTVKVDDRNVRAATLAPGDSVEIGNHRLTIIDSPVGFDLAIQIEVDEAIDAGEFEKAFRVDLDQLPVSNRVVAWILSAAILVFGFLVPLQGTVTGIEPGNSMAIVPSDAIWISGPLHTAHALAVGDQCRSCHQELFKRVQDEACLECHSAIVDHIEPHHLSSMPLLGPAPRCATCHREHTEPIPQLVVRADQLCTDCHSRSEQLFGSNPAAPVQGFSETAHPQFAAHLIKPTLRRAGTGVTFDWETTSQDVGSAVEMSNLKFPHDVHLDAELVTSDNSGDALGCGDCHRLSLDRQHFIPITMESVCVECHELTFDTQMPDRQLPHGEPLEVMIALEGQYLRNFSDPNVAQDAIVRRRLPDRPRDEPDCVGTAFACAAAAAATAIEEQFTIRGCISCHVVEDHGGRDSYARYQVFPVRLASDYFPAGRFDHFSHRVMRDDSGDAACQHCHEARASSSSSDLLIPDIDVCVACHSDLPKPDHVVLQCVDCHSYHPFGSTYTPILEASSQ